MVEEGVTLKKLVSILRRRLVTILIVAMSISMVTLLSVYYFVQPSYEANEYILIGNLDNDSKDYYEENQKINRMVASSIDFITSPMVMNTVLQKNNIGKYDLKDNLVVTNTKESQIIKITVTGDNPKIVKNVTQDVATTSVDKMGSLLKFKEVQVLSEDSTLITNSNKLLGSIIGCIIGLFLGIGAAIVKESFDPTIKESKEIENHHGLAILGQVDVKKKRYASFWSKERLVSSKSERGQNNGRKKGEKDKNLQAVK